jgi:dTMP kinase
LVPDLTLLLDIEPVLGRSRRLQRQSAKKLAIDRLEAESEAFYYRVREAYLNLAKQEPRRIRIIDAGKPLAQVGEEAWLQVRDVLERWGEQSLI